METLLAHIDRVVAAQWVTTICDSNPASPSLVFLRGLLLSEEVPEGWSDCQIWQSATESL
jgi:hypothetical protein